MKRKQSRSDAQQAAEIAALHQLNRQLGLELQPQSLRLGDSTVRVDGYHDSGAAIILVEIWAHVGPAKSAQRHKVLADVLKLAFVAQALREQRPQRVVQLYVVFIDDTAAQVLRNSSWGASAARSMGIETIVVAVDPALIDEVKAAQLKQDIRNAELDDTPPLPDQPSEPAALV